MNTRNSRRGAIRVLIVLAFSTPLCPTISAGEPASAPAAYGDRWVYCSFNLQVDKSVDDLIALIDRAAAAVTRASCSPTTSSRFFYRVPDFYFRNVERVKAAAARAKIELIPAVFSIGYSNGILAQIPISPRACRSSISPISSRTVWPFWTPGRPSRSRTAASKMTKGDQFTGFNWQDDPGVTTFADRSVRHQGGVACRFEPGKSKKGQTSPNIRLTQTVKLRPHTAYRFSCWVKTRALEPTGSFHLLALGTGPGGRQLTFHEGGLEPTRLEAGRSRIQQSRQMRGQPLRRLLGRGHGHYVGRRPGRSKSWPWSISSGVTAARSRSSPPTARRPMKKAVTSSQSSTPSSAAFPGRANSNSSMPERPSGSRPVRGSRTETDSA